MSMSEVNQHNTDENLNANVCSVIRKQCDYA